MVVMVEEICVYGMEVVLAGQLKIKRIGIIAEKMLGYSKAELKVQPHRVLAVPLFAV